MTQKTRHALSGWHVWVARSLGENTCLDDIDGTVWADYDHLLRTLRKRHRDVEIEVLSQAPGARVLVRMGSLRALELRQRPIRTPPDEPMRPSEVTCGGQGLEHIPDERSVEERLDRLERVVADHSKELSFHLGVASENVEAASYTDSNWRAVWRKSGASCSATLGTREIEP